MYIYILYVYFFNLYILKVVQHPNQTLCPPHKKNSSERHMKIVLEKPCTDDASVP